MSLLYLQNPKTERGGIANAVLKNIIDYIFVENNVPPIRGCRDDKCKYQATYQVDINRHKLCQHMYILLKLVLVQLK